MAKYIVQNQDTKPRSNLGLKPHYKTITTKYFLMENVHDNKTIEKSNSATNSNKLDNML